MDFKELLNIADHNKAVASSEASVKRYSSNLPPPKKMPKSGVLSSGVKAFLEKKQAEQRRIETEARKKKEELLALRAQNSKNNKKAKIMASRTKDNDFSRIKLTDDEIEAKKKREAEIMRQNLANKVERMKARIEMEEREMMLPKKRKRKSKHREEEDNHVDQIEEPVRNLTQKNNVKNVPNKNDVRKPRPPPPPTMSFAELLKIAEQKQYEPVKITVKKEEEKLMTKKERRLLEEELARKRRKEQMLQEKVTNEMRPSNRTPSTPVIKKKMPQNGVEQVTKQPVVIHVEKSTSGKQTPEPSKVKVPKNSFASNKSNQNGKVLLNKTQKLDQNIVKKQPDKGSGGKMISEVNRKLTLIKSNDNIFNDNPVTVKKTVPGKNKISNMNSSHLTPNVPPTPTVDVAKLEKELKEKLEKQLQKEYEEKYAAKLAFLQKQKALAEQKASSNKVPDKSKVAVPRRESIPVSKSMEQKLARREFEQYMAAKQAAARKAQKKAFHFNPYLDPPRRLLEPQLKPKPSSKYRIESDDEEDDDDDMSDFIVDGADGSQNDEDYSKYIQEIFGYDKSRYMDDDDDDEVMESSFSQVQKEEVRSARLGYLEDLEEERKLREEKKKKKKVKR